MLKLALFLAMLILMTPFERGFVKAAEVAGLRTKHANALLDLIRGHEGFSPTAYTLKGETYPTVGYGHNMAPGTSNLFGKLFGTSVDYNAVSTGKQALTRVQADQLLNQDILTKSNLANVKIPSLPTLPENVRNSVIDGFYRGDLSGSPKTIGLINKGDWAGAGKEFLNNNEYRNATSLGKPGIIPRMDNIANTFKGFAGGSSSPVANTISDQISKPPMAYKDFLSSK